MRSLGKFIKDPSVRILIIVIIMAIVIVVIILANFHWALATYQTLRILHHLGKMQSVSSVLLTTPLMPDVEHREDPPTLTNSVTQAGCPTIQF